MCFYTGSNSYRAWRFRDLRNFYPDNPQCFPHFCGKSSRKMPKGACSLELFVKECCGNFCGSSGKIRGCCVDLLRTVPILSPKQIVWSVRRKSRYIHIKIRPPENSSKGSVVPLSPQVQKLCQQAEQEKDFRKLLLLVSQINHVFVLKSQPPPSKEMLRSSIPDKQTRW